MGILLARWGVCALLTSCAALLQPPGVAAQQAAEAALPEPLVADVAAGRSRAALRRLSALPKARQQTSPVRYLRGRLLQRIGRYPAAIRALPTSGTGLPAELDAPLRLRRARLLARLGRCGTAEPLIEGLLQTAEFAARARALQAECAEARGAHAEAAKAYAAALEAGDERLERAVLLDGQARCAGAAGDVDTALRALRTLYLQEPQSPLAAGLAGRVSALGGALSLTVQERFDRARRLLDLHMPAEAEATLADPWPALQRSERAELLHLRGMALFSQRTRYPEAAEVLRQAARIGREYALGDAFHAARALARADRDPAAVRAFRRIARFHPQHRYGVRSAFLAGFLGVRHDLPGGARGLLSFAEGPMADRMPGLGRRAWLLLGLHDYDHGRFARAQKRLLRYAEAARNDMDRAQGLYWAGRAAQRARRRAAAIRHLRAARDIDPLHYYGLLAHGRLRALSAASAAPYAADTVSATEPAAQGAAPLPALPAFFASLGLRADAAAALHGVATAYRHAAPAGLGPRHLAEAFARLGDHGAAYRELLRRARRDLRAPPHGAHAWAHRLAYPRPHAALVERLATMEGVSADHVLAIMRKESAFDPQVVSSADAIGLLQLLPQTGARVAAALGLPFERAALFDPETNLRLGIHYIGDLFRRFEGHPVLAIAAFNAGEHRVDAWLRRAAELGAEAQDSDRFVESIPIDQTRNYVRRVLSNWARYRYLADPSAGFPAPWPSSVSAAAPAESAARRR